MGILQMLYWVLYLIFLLWTHLLLNSNFSSSRSCEIKQIRFYRLTFFEKSRICGNQSMAIVNTTMTLHYWLVLLGHR